MLLYLSMPLGITAISTSKLFSSLKIMCPSYPCKLWKIIGNFLGILSFKLRLCAAPLNLPVTWQWSLTLSVFNSSLHIQQIYELWQISSSSQVIINLLSKYFLVICLVHFYLSSTHLINLLIQSLPSKIIGGKVNLSSIHTNFAPIELAWCSWYFVVFSPSLILVLFKKHCVSIYFKKNGYLFLIICKFYYSWFVIYYLATIN